MGTSALQLTDVTIERGNGTHAVAVIRNFSLTVQVGEIVAVLGASGRGKSTLLHAIAGLIPAVQGNIQAVSDQPGLVFQESLLLPWLTVRQNIALAYQFKKHYATADSQLVSQRIDTLLRVVGLTHLQERMPSALSGGQAQRVSIARALVHNPELLLLDEPFSALDAVTSSQLHEVLLESRDQLNTTIVLVTHDIQSALSVADRVIVLKDDHSTEVVIPAQDQRKEHEELILTALGGSYVI